MTKLTEDDIDELRSFIVDSNLEYSFINQLNHPEESKKRLKTWLGI